MRTHSDPKLGLLAKRIANSQFTHALDVSAEKLSKLQTLRSEGKLRGIQWMLPGKFPGGYSIRLYIGGKNRFLGFFKTDWLSACRLADMIILRIGPMRLKHPKPNTEEDYNFSEEQAKLDWRQEPVIAALLLEVEEHLKSTGALNPKNSLTLAERVFALESQLEALTKRFNEKTKVV